MKSTLLGFDENEIKRLYALGLGLHWLHPREKRPIESNWANGKRASLDDLIKSYKRGYNVGVKLGRASKIGEGFLAAIDCDVKGSKPRHQAEMRARFLELFPEKGILTAPGVRSGRGNGSEHVYILTKLPAAPKRLAQSTEKVLVVMPSAKKPSRFECERLSRDELARGLRIRPAWEISLMGEGQQVVLPPSLHPDTGERYAWSRPLKSLPPYIDTKEAVKPDQKAVSEIRQDFKPVDVDLIGSKLTSAIVDEIIEGEGSSDRSASLLRVSNAMFKAGFTETEILSVLTDPNYYLGQAGYEHAQTRSRARAAAWVKRYTVDKSRASSDATEVFNDEVDIDDAPLLSSEAAEAQAAEILTETDWRDELERGSPESGGRLKNTLKNVIAILKGEGGDDIFKRDDFANSEIYGQTAPWGGHAGAELADIDTIRIKTWLAKKWRFEPSNDRINEAMMKIADDNRFHPVRDYLDGLAWDGVPRIDTWLKTYLNAVGAEPYLSAISRKVLVAMVKRIYEPGCKFDQVLILEGKQGKGKSTAVRMLAGDKWFTDATINVHDKDAIMTMRSMWIIEQGELSSLRRSDVDQFKEFVSRTTDRIRVPYGKRTENFPRQCIFIGTTNSREYLKDSTGNRRFWPVEVGACDFQAVARDRDQLLAEARFAYELGEPLYLEQAEMVETALLEQDARSVHDAWEDILLDWLSKDENEDSVSPRVDRNKFRTQDLFADSGPFAGWKLDISTQRRCTEHLSKLGYRNISRHDPLTKKNHRFWSKAV